MTNLEAKHEIFVIKSGYARGASFIKSHTMFGNIRMANCAGKFEIISNRFGALERAKTLEQAEKLKKEWEEYYDI